jgi:hypothetical protein
MRRLIPGLTHLEGLLLPMVFMTSGKDDSPQELVRRVVAISTAVCAEVGHDFGLVHSGTMHGLEQRTEECRDKKHWQEACLVCGVPRSVVEPGAIQGSVSSLRGVIG